MMMIEIFGKFSLIICERGRDFGFFLYFFLCSFIV